MSAPSLATVRNRLETLIALAGLLERVERAGVKVGAEQYRSLVRQVSLALADELPVDALQAVLGAHPAAAELYENLHYEQSGLSRSPLERSINAELLAGQVLAKAALRG